MTLKQLIVLYLEQGVTDLKPSTIYRYKCCIKNYVSKMENRKVVDIKRIDVQGWINDTKLSPKSVRTNLACLSSIFQFAMKIELVETSPCKDILLPKLNSKEAAYLDSDAILVLIKAIENVSELKYQILLLLALFGGLKKGEILALKWEDIDYKEQTIRTRANRAYTPKVGTYEDTNKTGKQRTFSLPQFCFEKLENFRKQKEHYASQLKVTIKDVDNVICDELLRPIPVYTHIFDKKDTDIADMIEEKYKIK